MNYSTTIMVHGYSQPMIQSLDHVGIAVKDLNAAITRYTQLLGFPPSRIEEVPTEAVKVAFFKVGDTQIELLAATRPDSSIAQFIAKRGEGVHHLAFRVGDIDAAVKKYQNDGFTIIDKNQPHSGVEGGATQARIMDSVRPGAHGSKVVFLHPKSALGTLIELVEVDT